MSEEKTFLEQLVETKGENFKDPEVIAKSKLEADNHIQSLERQIEELKEDLNNKTSASDVLEAINKKAEEIKNFSFEPPKDTEQQSTPLSSEDLTSLVTSILDKRSVETKSEENKRQAHKLLTETYGDNAGEAVKEAMSKLGVSDEDLVGLAAKSPTAFASLVKSTVEVKKETNTFTPTEVNTATPAFDGKTTRDYDYYKKLRRENPDLYYSAKIQRQMDQDALSLGDKFFN